MAEIKIEKKSPIWPWILLIVIVVGILIYVFASDDDVDNLRDDSMDNTEQPMNERDRGNSGQPLDDTTRNNTRQPLNSLPDSSDGDVTLLGILKSSQPIGLG